MKKTDAPILKYSAKGRSRKIEDFLLRPPVEKGADEIARKVLEDIRKKGDSAVLKFARQFDRAPEAMTKLRVSEIELAAAKKAVDAKFKKAAKEEKKAEETKVEDKQDTKKTKEKKEEKKKEEKKQKTKKEIVVPKKPPKKT